MSPKRVAAARRPRGTAAWILAELRSLKPKVRLSTSEITRRITKASGRRYHPNSVYNSLRLLVRRGEVKVKKSGREKLYRVSEAGRQVVAEIPKRARRGRGRRQTASGPPASSPAPAPLGSTVPHPKLASGEILVLHVTEAHLVSATNRRGKLVLKKHRMPR